MWRGKKPFFFLLLFVMLSASVFAVTYPVTESTGQTVGTSGSVSGFSGMTFTTNTSNLVLVNATVVSGVIAENFTVVNSSSQIICVFNISNSSANCVLPYIGEYSILAGSGSGTHTRIFQSFTSYPINGQVLAWNNYVDAVADSCYTLGCTITRSPNSTAFRQTVNSITLNASAAGDSLGFDTVSVSSRAPALNVNYSIRLTSGGSVNLTNVTFGFDNGTGTLVNMTPVSLSGSLATVSLQRFTNTAFGSTIRFQWYVRGTNGTTFNNDTPVQSYVTNYTKNGTVNYTKYLLNGNAIEGNPVGKANLTTGFSQVAHAEMSTWEENGTIYQMYHTHDSGGAPTHHLVVVNTTNPFVMNGNEKNIPELQDVTFQFIAYTGNQSVRINGNLTLFAANKTSPQEMHVFTATNPYGVWHDLCGAPMKSSTNATILGGNPSVYYHSDTGTWDMILDNNTNGYIDDFWNSTNPCTGWVDQAVNANGFGALNSWMSYFNGTYIQYYSVLNGSEGYTNHYARGNRLDNMTLVTPDAFSGLPLQTLEVAKCISTCDWSDQDMLIIPPNDRALFPMLFGGWAFYYVADQNNTFVATDTDGRTFYAAHNISPVAESVNPSNATPAMVTANATVTSNNVTLVMRANATDTDGDLLRYYWTVYNATGYALGNGSAGMFSQGVTVNFANFTFSVNGTYWFSVLASDLNTNSSSLNSNNVTVTFNVNQAPVMRNASVSVTSDNMTLFVMANSTDADNTTVRYHTFLNRSGVVSDQGYSGYVTSGVFLNFVNFTLTQNGNYSVLVAANDGNSESSNFSSNVQEVTFPSSPPSVNSGTCGTQIVTVVFAIGLIVLAGVLLFFMEGFGLDEYAKYIYIVIGVGVLLLLFSFVAMSGVC